MILKADAERVLARLPRDVKDFLDREAQKYGSSRNSELVRCVRMRMDRIQPEHCAD